MDILYLSLILLLTAGIYFFSRYNARQNQQIGVTRHTYRDPRIPPTLDGYRLLVLSDLHNVEFGPDNNHLLTQVSSAQPHLIAITGDIINKRAVDFTVIERLLPRLTKIAPVVYVTGNHEPWTGRFAELEALLIANGVTILDETQMALDGPEAAVLLMGARDPDFYGRRRGMPAFTSRLTERVKTIDHGQQLTILLSHRCELLDVYAGCAIDLVLTGHAHGGQVRLPGLPGLFSPDQWFFPRYTSGAYRQGATTMIVSRGLASLYFPPRIFNPPELLLIELKSS